MTLRRRQVLAAAALPWAGPPPGVADAAPSLRLRLDGMVWQPSRRTLRPQGQWQRLGVARLLVQWTAVDDLALLPGAGLPLMPPDGPDWGRIAGEPWAHEVILGLAGTHDEARARSSLEALAAQSRAMWLAAAPWPLRVGGWYFPVEADPSWAPPPEWLPVLAQLPRPLWLSVYDGANLGPRALLQWIERWVPVDVGIFFQDGVGVHARNPVVARQYLEVLTRGLGAARVRVIAEAFRPARGGGFRSASADEFLPQIEAYGGWPIYAFDGPHYLDEALVEALAARGVGRG